MDTEKMNVNSAETLTEEQPEIEIEAVEENSEQPATKKKWTAKWMDNLVSVALLVLYVLLTGAVTSWLEEMVRQASLDGVIANYITFLLYVGLGTVLFFATRTGEGKTVYRINWFSIGLIVLPVVAIIVGVVLMMSAIVEIAWLDTFVNRYIASFYLALVLLGYAIPYSFISGFERKYEEAAVEEFEEEIVFDEEEQNADEE